MVNIIRACYKKNRVTILRAYPMTFILQKFLNSVIGIFIPFFIYRFIFFESVSSSFFTYSRTSDYITYISLGHLVNAIAFSTLLNVGRCIIIEIREGTIDSFVLSPASRVGFFLGTYIEQLSRTFVEVFFVLVISIFLGANLFGFHLLLMLFILSVIVSFVSFSMAILLASIMVFTRDTFITQNTIFIILSIICGASFPVEFLPVPVQFLSSLIPITYAIDIFRSILILNYSVVQVFPKMFIMIILSFIYFVFGYVWYKKLEVKVIEEVFS